MARRSPLHTSGQPVRHPVGPRRPAPGRLAALCGMLGAAGALCTAGCERQAPGPEECVAFAEAWMRRHHAPSHLEADAAFDELVRTCLTDPYDRELVTCVVGGRDQERCRVDYMRRVETRREISER